MASPVGLRKLPRDTNGVIDPRPIPAPGTIAVFEGARYAATEGPRPGAIELHSSRPDPGFIIDDRPAPRAPYHRFVHVTEIEKIIERRWLCRWRGEWFIMAADWPTTTVRLIWTGHNPEVAARLGLLPQEGGYHIEVPWAEVEDVEVVEESRRPPLGDEYAGPLLAPLTSPPLSREAIHELSQHPPTDDAEAALLRAVRATATLRRGTPMVKGLSGRQVSQYLRLGWQLRGFCYREFDVAHLREPTDLRTITTGELEPGEVPFLLRWRVADPSDYVIPWRQDFPGLAQISPHNRVGPPFFGTGFAPSARHLIPEYVTVDLADLPLPARAEILALGPGGSEITLFQFFPEQRAWSRLTGNRWRHLLQNIPDIDPDQEWFPVRHPPATELVGQSGGAEYPAMADPPDQFRILSRIRLGRFSLETVVRRTHHCSWRGEPFTVVVAEGNWLRLRARQPREEMIRALGLEAVERGVYETWVPAGEVTDRHIAQTSYL